MRSGKRRHGNGPHVLIVGGGFAGLSALHVLAKSDAQVTLVDRNVYSTFQPLLYQVATAGLTSADVAYPLWSVTRKTRAHFRKAELAGLDLATRTARLADGTQLQYDYLVLATGVSANFYGVKGAQEHSLSLYTRRDAIALRNRMLDEFERRASGDADAELDITVVGGGATGVELAGTLAELRNIALPAAFPEIDRSKFRVRLIEMAPALLTPYRQRERDYARQQLVNRGVDVFLDTTIKEIAPGKVTLADGSSHRSDMTVWAAGIQAPDALWNAQLPRAKAGRIDVGPDLRVTGHENRVRDRRRVRGRSPLPQLSAARPSSMARHAGAADHAADDGTADCAFPLPRQGHHGDDRPPVRGGGAVHRNPAARHRRLAGLAGPAPVLPAGRPQPAGDIHQSVLALPQLEPGRRADRRRRSA